MLELRILHLELVGKFAPRSRRNLRNVKDRRLVRNGDERITQIHLLLDADNRRRRVVHHNTVLRMLEHPGVLRIGLERGKEVTPRHRRANCLFKQGAEALRLAIEAAVGVERRPRVEPPMVVVAVIETANHHAVNEALNEEAIGRIV